MMNSDHAGVILIVGLGNPGPEYRSNRHNIGFMLIERLADRFGINLDRKRNQAAYGIGNIRGRRTILAKPMTYMNSSGRAVQGLISFFKLEAEQMIVLHDDLDMEIGKIRTRDGGGHGGHNGLRSIIASIKTGDFKRIKVGIGRPGAGQTPEQWVLQDFTGEEWEIISGALDRAVDIAVKKIEA